MQGHHSEGSRNESNLDSPITTGTVDDLDSISSSSARAGHCNKVGSGTRYQLNAAVRAAA